MSMKITKTCRMNRTMSMDLDIEGVGILYVEDNSQVFSESFLLLSTTSGYANIKLTPGQVVTPELPVLLTEEETQMLESLQDQADGTLGALDALMTRRLAAEQHEINLRDLLTEMQRNQHERHYNWLIAAIALTVTILIMYLTSPLLELASLYALRRTRVPAKVPLPKPRDARTCTLPMEEEDCEVELKPIMGDTRGTSGGKIVDPRYRRRKTPSYR
jgi:hypothetical protein